MFSDKPDLSYTFNGMSVEVSRLLKKPFTKFTNKQAHSQKKIPQKEHHSFEQAHRVKKGPVSTDNRTTFTFHNFFSWEQIFQAKPNPFAEPPYTEKRHNLSQKHKRLALGSHPQECALNC